MRSLMAPSPFDDDVADPRPANERNDYLQSSVGPERSNRPADIVTAARNLNALGYLQSTDRALSGVRTKALGIATRQFQNEQKGNNKNFIVDGAYGPATQAVLLPKLHRMREMERVGFVSDNIKAQTNDIDLVAHVLGEKFGKVQGFAQHNFPAPSELAPAAMTQAINTGLERMRNAKHDNAEAASFSVRGITDTGAEDEKPSINDAPKLAFRFIPPGLVPRPLPPMPKFVPRTSTSPGVSKTPGKSGPNQGLRPNGSSKPTEVTPAPPVVAPEPGTLEPKTDPIEYAPEPQSLEHAVDRSKFLEDFAKDVLRPEYLQKDDPAQKGKPYRGGSRGNRTTRRGDDIVAEVCREVLREDYSDLADRVSHIKGAHEDGQNGYLKQEHVVDLDNKKDFRRPDLTWRIDDEEYAKSLKAPRARMNTQDMSRAGVPSDRERMSLENLKRLIDLSGKVKEAIAHGMPKMTRRHTESEFRKIAKDACKGLFREWLGKPRPKRPYQPNQKPAAPIGPNDIAPVDDWFDPNSA